MINLTLLTPADGENLHSKTPSLTAKYEDTENSLVAKLTLEIDRVGTFNTEFKQIQSYENVESGNSVNWIPATPLDNGFWYWRVIADNEQEQIVSNTQSFQITAGVLKRTLYQYENITDDHPFPYIEKLSINKAEKGSIITIYGNGFGTKFEDDVTNTDRAQRGYGGFVYMGKVQCSVISWSWQQIEFQVPNEAETAGVKVVLTKPTERESNVVGLEIIEDRFVKGAGLEFLVCEKSNPNTVIAYLDAATDKSFQTLLNKPGGGRFSISRCDIKGSDRSIISDQNLILCRLNGVDVMKWIIESRNPKYIDETEHQMIEVTGRGVLSLLDHAVVYPEEMPKPKTLKREFKDINGGAIFRKLLLEAQNRGCLPGVVIDWTDTADSVGNFFEDSTTISFNIGTPLSVVAEKLGEGMGLFDFEMTPDLRLRIYKSKGTDMYKEVKYRPGQGIIAQNNKSNSSRIKNTLIVEGEDGTIVETTHPTSQKSYGRREGYLQANNVKSEWADLQDYGQMQLKYSSQVAWGIQGEVVDFYSKGIDIEPFRTFNNGDWIGWYVPPEGADDVGVVAKLRVKGITCIEEGETGALTYVLELNNIIVENEIKIAQMIKRMSMYTENSVLTDLDRELTKRVRTVDLQNEIKDLRLRVEELERKLS